MKHIFTYSRLSLHITVWKTNRVPFSSLHLSGISYFCLSWFHCNVSFPNAGVIIVIILLYLKRENICEFMCQWNGRSDIIHVYSHKLCASLWLSDIFHREYLSRNRLFHSSVILKSVYTFNVINIDFRLKKVCFKISKYF